MGKKFMGLDGTDHFWDRAKAWILNQITSAGMDKQSIIDAVYPVGSLYWSSKDTDPSTLFGGTWVQIKDRFVLACGDTCNTTGATGGSATVQLTESNLPAHSHGMNHHYSSGTTGYNNKEHTHNFSHTHSTNTASLSGSFIINQCSYYTSNNGIITKKNYTSHNVSGTSSSHQGYEITVNASHSHSTTSQSTSTTGNNSQNHQHSWSAWSGDSCTTQNDSTARYNTDSTGSGTSFSILPPYVVKYCWERTA